MPAKKKTAKKKTAKKKTAKKKTAKKKTAKKKTAKKKTAKKKTAKKKTAKKKTAKKKTAKKKTAKKKTAKKKTAKKKTAKKKTASPTAAKTRATRSPRSATASSAAPTRRAGDAPIAGERLRGSSQLFEEAFALASVQVRAIGVRLRRLILGTLPAPRETAFGGGKVRGLQYYAARDAFPVVTLQAGPGYCLFYFKEGTSLEDPYRLLAGSGSTIRHIKVHDFENPTDAILEDYLVRALRLAGYPIV